MHEQLKIDKWHAFQTSLAVLYQQFAQDHIEHIAIQTRNEQFNMKQFMGYPLILVHL